MWGGRAGALLRAWGLWPAGALGRRPLSCNAASPAGSNSAGCWNCGSPVGPVRKDGLFCSQCRALLPPDPTQDYFSLLDWYGRGFREAGGGQGVVGCCLREGTGDQAQEGGGGTGENRNKPIVYTHTSFFSQSPSSNRSFRVDTAKLQHRYQQLQRLVHPDFFSQRSQVLKLRGVEIPEGTDYEMDRQFLMEIMEINEKLAEIQSEAAMKEIESVVRAKQKELTDSVSRAFEQEKSSTHHPPSSSPKNCDSKGKPHVLRKAPPGETSLTSLLSQHEKEKTATHLFSLWMLRQTGTRSDGCEEAPQH
ncbi:Iron-sulfur cluster co-chaperone protein HscB [Galemys pyrenaicus]|uniref:Iron-sulfur cluster co-chaperone protein HscB n=1 Tax=Galemys pyrenaicus TaxID=202257 RepID=A0A8J6AGD8_GALPY|nr:Iron-sulfur cluster co-chaperone protein HscB [Galemys pyrenaicus]